MIAEGRQLGDCETSQDEEMLMEGEMIVEYGDT